MSYLGQAGQRVELVGEFPDWNHPIAMTEVTPGDYHCSLALAPGVYRYKFRLDQRLWFPDPRATLIDTSNPFQNAILVIGGIDAPFLFAPDRRHVALGARGRLVVQIELPRHVALPIELLVNVPGTGRIDERARFFEITSQRGFKILRAELTLPELADPALPAHFRFSTHPEQRFALAAFREERATPPATAPSPPPPLTSPSRTHAPRPLSASRLSQSEAPPWLGQSVFYAVLIDRWHRGQASPPLPQAHARAMPPGPRTFYGGDFDGLREHLDHIQSLGCDALLLTPVHPSPSPLRQTSTDLLSVDPALGGEAGLRRLIEAAHARQMRIVLETAITHLSAQHLLYARLAQDPTQPEYAEWFHLPRRTATTSASTATPLSSNHHPQSQHRENADPALDLRQENPRRYAMRSLEALLRFGIDGLLFQGMSEAPVDFWRQLRQRLRRLNPNLLLLGAPRGDNLANLSGSAGVDAVHDARQRENLLAFFGAESIDAASFCDRLSFDDVRLGPLPPDFSIQSLDALDTPGFPGAARLQSRLRLSLLCLFLRPGPICLTYGTELGLGADLLSPGFSLDERDKFGRERLPMPTIPREPTMTGALIARLAELRRSLPALRGGIFKAWPVAERAFGVERRATGGQCVRAYLNAGRLPIPMPRLPLGARCLLEVNVPLRTPPALLPGDSGRLFVVGEAG
jgi:neopullulanase